MCGDARRNPPAPIHAIVSIGRALGLQAVAEGVETAEHWTFLAAAGVHGLQGNLFAPPMGAAEVAGFTARIEGVEQRQQA